MSTWKKLVKILKKKENYLLVSLSSVIFTFLIYLFVVKSATFKNEIDYKDLISLLINGIFLFYITRFFHKKDDQNRKEKDLLIQELLDLRKLIKLEYNNLKSIDFPISQSSLTINSLRDNVQSVKDIILLSEFGESYTDKIDTEFRCIQSNLRSIERIINPGNYMNNSILQEHINVMNLECQNALKCIYRLSIDINKS
ncbi:hypothetical protein [Elizabethkingia anophelis]|uniref:hypothetical protein n=1 Tax=Elizabethkingia anophelis TaxID=1117645 RepID=UPI001370E91F|nr:hypothetical protein [Elizabethkingia anophelis]MCT4124521.1 hypothetical protein [Elizabethkingia anophelis]MDV3876304.1 hypothetical protein [Elizabethkingia anophelis]MYY44184.1 hypothetical protein [Elizabethkingia anophelis]